MKELIVIIAAIAGFCLGMTYPDVLCPKQESHGARPSGTTAP